LYIYITNKKQLKTGVNGIKKIAVISFSMIYLLLALTYMHLLPNYNSLLRNGYYYPGHHVVAKTHTSLSTTGHHTRLQKLFYATPENKKDVFAGVLLIGAIVTTLFTIIVTIATGAQQAHGDMMHYALLHRHAYLQFRSLRL
jgi:hypothetical protein